MKIAIVTHAGLPDGAPDDHALAGALQAHGASVSYTVWDDPAVDWSSVDRAVIRSTWDYHRSPARWLAWLDRVATLTELVNAPELVRWNTDKRYLLDLAAASVPIVPTVLVNANADLAGLAVARGWTDIVIKPAIGASAEGARRFSQSAIVSEGGTHLTTLLGSGPALLQPYQSAIETARERSLVWIGDDFSHAFTKPGFNTAVGGGALERYDPSLAEMAFAIRVLNALPERPLVARIDMIPTATGPLLMEAELIEPQLALHYSKTGAVALAMALCGNHR